jgi:nucleoside-diphosphate-sugar epimerase
MDLETDPKQKIESSIKGIKPDVLIHCACYDYHFDSNVRETIQTNIIGTLNLFDACKGAMIINSGSSAEYGIRTDPMKETDPVAPNTNHAISKAIMTNLVTSIKAITLRPFSVYGYYEGMHRLIPYLVYSSIKKQRALLLNPNEVRDFVFVEDMVRAYELAISKYGDIEERIFNVGSGVQTTVEQVARMLKLEYDTKPRKEVQKVWQADIGRIGRELGWKPEYTLKEGLEKTKRWMAENIELYEGGKE